MGWRYSGGNRAAESSVRYGIYTQKSYYDSKTWNNPDAFIFEGGT